MAAVDEFVTIAMTTAQAELVVRALRYTAGADAGGVDSEAFEDEQRAEMIAMAQLLEDAEPIRACRECGCTDDQACAGGCYWVEPNLCSACA